MKRLLWVALACVGTATIAAQQTTTIAVGWIAREPRMIAPVDDKGPRDAGWPRVGSTVHWVAHVFNHGAETAERVHYVWSDADAILADSAADLAPGETTLSVPWTWSGDRHRITLAVGDAAPLGIDTDALSIGFWVEQSTYDWLRQEGRPTFEGLFQREIARWNGLFAKSISDTTPDGVHDRVRLDRVVVVPDKQRLRNADLIDSDLYYMFYEGSDPRFLQKGSSEATMNDQTIVLHELLHQRGLIDLYAYPVTHSFGTDEDGRVNITENGKPVVGTFLMPLSGLTAFNFFVQDLMAASYRFATTKIGEHSANGLNLWAGRRTPLSLDKFGNVINAWANVGAPDSYATRLPKSTAITLIDQSTGGPIPSAVVDVYCDHNQATYKKTYGALPDFTFASDAAGVLTLPGDILEHQPTAKAPPKAQVIILGVRTPRGRGFAFIPVYTLNMLSFRNGADAAPMDLAVKLIAW